MMSTDYAERKLHLVLNESCKDLSNFLDPFHIQFVTYNFEYNHNNWASYLLLHVFTVLQKKCVPCSAHFCTLPLSLRYVWEQT